jgi:hypothetical protein
VPAAAGEQQFPFDTTVAHPARVYDYWLGGKDNFAADREAGDRALAAGRAWHRVSAIEEASPAEWRRR